MKTNEKRRLNGGVEATILFALLTLFVGVLGVAWVGAMSVRQTIAANAEIMNIDTSALVELEQIRNLNESRIANRRAYFLLGNKSIFEKQQEQKQLFVDALAKFEKEHSLPQGSEIIEKIKALEQQDQDFFAQGSDFRDKQTESKIVAQFYHSKASPIITQFEEKISQLVKLHEAEIAAAQSRAREAGQEAHARIHDGMTWLTGTLMGLFVAMALLVVRMLWVRRKHLRERNRLVEEAKNAILARDEVISAASRDLREPLNVLSDVAESLESGVDAETAAQSAEVIRSTVSEMHTLIDDIYDQKKADMGNLNLRLEQLPMADLLDEAQAMLQPLAKQRTINLQFDTVNPSVLAYVDRERVLRVLSNLVGNAIKFSQKNTRISVKVKSDAQFVNVSVIDTSPGIPDQQLGGIFENFWQAPKTADQGAGVGLAVVKTIIDAHGGTVKAENTNIGQGCTFTFSLPRRRPAGAQLKKPPVPEVRVTRRSGGSLENSAGSVH